ncbi:MAG: sugar phosphate nucleotidyltransferase, partial [Kiritimatiellae bacterium]|nr:sugar phosphate nucleotidyltransferase [Kiritimatiellia bacterium]
MKAIIPAAGYGTRFLPATKAVPKEMLPIGNKPALQWLVEEALSAGADEVIIVTSPGKNSIRKYFTPDPTLTQLVRAKPAIRDELEKLDALSAKV